MGKTTQRRNDIVDKLRDSAPDLPRDIGLLDSTTPPDTLPPEQCIGLGSDDSPFQTVSRMMKTGVWQIVQAGQNQTEDRIRFAARLIQKPGDFLSNPAALIFSQKRPLASQREPYKEQRWEFRSSSEKSSLKRELLNFAETASGVRPLLSSIDYIADELITNAIYNAPFGDEGVTLDRTTAVVLDADMMAQMVVAYDNEKLFLGCVDLFGSLNCEQLLRRLFRAYKIGVSKTMNMGKGGAGIGLIRVIDLAKEIFAVVEENKKTIVGCTFLLGKTSNKVKNTAKNFHFLGYETVDMGGLTARLEKKANRVFVKMFGSLSGKTDLFKISLGKAKYLHLDFRSVEQWDKAGLANLLEWAESLSLGQKITCTSDAVFFADTDPQLKKRIDRLFSVQLFNGV